MAKGSMGSGGVRSGIDVGRLAAAVSRPGIDPRLWLTLAIVQDVAIDTEQGIFADVQFIPDGDEETCLVGSEYAGAGFGTFIPPKVDDIVLVAVPYGDVGTGPIIITRIWNGANPPSTDFKAETEIEEGDVTSDPTTVVEPQRTYKIIAKEDATIRLEVDGSGKIEIAATGQAQVEITGDAAVIVNSPDVRLGVTAGNPVARVGDIVISTVPALAVTIPPPVGLTIPVLPVAPAVPTPTLGSTAVGQITSGAQSVKA